MKPKSPVHAKLFCLHSHGKNVGTLPFLTGFMKQRIQIGLWSLLALLLAGCISRNTGYRISDETIAFIQPGVTTRAEVVENLGPPLFELKDPHVVAYSWGKVKPAVSKAPAAEQGFQPTPFGYGAGGVGSTAPASPWEGTDSVESRRWICCVALNEKDVVTRSGKFELKGATSLEKAVREWVASGQ